MKMLIAATMSLCALVSAPLSAQSNPVVVELFTSQGCSSCPPADAILRRLSQQEDVIALALHVDYWDYIGWKDQFARPAHSVRQRGYADVAGRDMIYTPQMIVNGSDDVVGVHAEQIADLIERHETGENIVTLRVEREGRRLRVDAAPVAGALQGGPLLVQVVQYTPLKSVDITRGENVGNRLVYANVVDDWLVLDDWTGADAYEAEIELGSDRPAVVLIQYPGPGKIVGATVAK